MFMDLRKQTWDPKLCDFFGINMDILPKIKSSSEVYGKVKGGALDGVEIAGIVGDQVSITNRAVSPVPLCIELVADRAVNAPRWLL